MVRSPAFTVLAILGLFGASNAWAQSPAERAENDAVGASINYVFATDLGSGVYDLDGRTLQIYQLTYEKALREVGPEEFGVKFEVPVTFGFFDFRPTDVLSSGLPTRVDSFAVVPGFEFDYLVKEGMAPDSLRARRIQRGVQQRRWLAVRCRPQGGALERLSWLGQIHARGTRARRCGLSRRRCQRPVRAIAAGIRFHARARLEDRRPRDGTRDLCRVRFHRRSADDSG